MRLGNFSLNDLFVSKLGGGSGGNESGGGGLPLTHALDYDLHLSPSQNSAIDQAHSPSASNPLVTFNDIKDMRVNKEFTLNFGYNYENIALTVPAGYSIDEIFIDVNTAFNGLSPSIIVQDSDNIVLIPSDETDLSIQARFAFVINKTYPQSKQIKILYSPNGSTTGSLKITFIIKQ